MRPETIAYLKNNPCARTSSIIQREKQADKHDQLRQEIAAAKRVNEYRDSIGYVPWTRRLLSALVRGWGAV